MSFLVNPYSFGAGVAPVVAWAPTDEASLELWLDATDAATLTLTGSLVDQWRDKSGKGRHASASGSLRPTHGATSLSTATPKPGMTFASGQRMAGSIALANGGMVLMVVQQANAGGTYGRMISFYGSGTSDYNNPANWAALTRNNGSANGDSTYNSSGDPSDGGGSYNTPYIRNAHLMSGGTTIVGHGREQTWTRTLSVTDPNGNFNANNYTIGGGADGGQFFNGVISEILVFTEYDSLILRKAQGYLAHKYWGAGALNNLPSWHYFKTTAPQSDFSIWDAADSFIANVVYQTDFQPIAGALVPTDGTANARTATAATAGNLMCDLPMWGKSNGRAGWTLSDYTGFQCGSGQDFCVEAYVTNTGTNSSFVQNICGQGTANRFALNIHGTAASRAMKLSASDATAYDFTVGASLQAGTGIPQHVAYERSGDTLRAYLDGVVVSTWTGVSGKTFFAGTSFGLGRNGTSQEDYLNALQAFRFTKAARYNGAFTPNYKRWRHVPLNLTAPVIAKA